MSFQLKLIGCPILPALFAREWELDLPSFPESGKSMKDTIFLLLLPVAPARTLPCTP
jgi:hypothetical protein